MTSLIQALLTALVTIGVFVIGQLIQRIFIEPIQEVRRTVGRIIHAHTFYANYMARRPIPFVGYEGMTVGNPPDEMKSAAIELRKLASDLRGSYQVVPLRKYVPMRWCIWPRATIEIVSSALIGWSNALIGGSDSGECKKKIADALGLYPKA